MRFISSRVLAVGIALVAPVMAAQAQAHEYRLNNSLADTWAGPSLVNVGGGSLSGSGFAFSAGQGLSLTGALTNLNSYSLVFRSKAADYSNSSDGNVKLVDYLNRTDDAGYYAANWVGNSGRASFCPECPQDNTDNLYVAGTYVTTTLTRSAAGLFTAYVNGTSEFSFTDTTPDAVASGNILNFFLDDVTGDGGEQTDGAVNYIALWNRDLSGAEVAAFNPDAQHLQDAVAAPEPASLVLLATGLFGVAGVARRRKSK